MKYEDLYDFLNNDIRDVYKELEGREKYEFSENDCADDILLIQEYSNILRTNWYDDDDEAFKENIKNIIEKCFSLILRTKELY
jgi:hypothetical protein